MNLLKASNAPDHLLGSVSQLAKHDINGRQIRTIIRMAGACALQENRPILISDLLSTIKLTTDFVKEIKGK